MFNISKELIIVVVIVLIIFGPTQLPKLGKMFGKTMKGLREGIDNPDAEDESAPEPEAKPKEVAAAAEDPADELARLKAENAKLAAAAAKKADAEDAE